MAPKPRLTDAARIDRQKIRAWFLQAGSGPAAKERLIRIQNALASVAEAPYSHPVGPLPGTRLLVTQRHRVLFRVILGADRTTVRYGEILRIFGPGPSDTGQPAP